MRYGNATVTCGRAKARSLDRANVAVEAFGLPTKHEYWALVASSLLPWRCIAPGRPPEAESIPFVLPPPWGGDTACGARVAVATDLRASAVVVVVASATTIMKLAVR